MLQKNMKKNQIKMLFKKNQSKSKYSVFFALVPFYKNKLEL